MTNLSLDRWIEEYMIFCRSRQLRGKTLDSYEQGLRLFERWCKDTLNIDTLDKISEGVIRRYYDNFCPKFVKKYAEIGKELERAFSEYVAEVKGGQFPIDGVHTYKISDEERAKIEAMF